MLKRIATYASFVRFSHSVFALPFALVGALLAWRTAPFTWSRVAWIVVAMVSARSAAMAFNRLADARYDALNPRTASREIPSGALGRSEATAFLVLCSAAFVLAAYELGPVCFALSPVALAIVFWYSLAKRVTHFAQMFLGLALAVAPVGGWLAAGGRAGWEPVLLAFAIGSWVAGFDILYALQDLDFDRAHGLRSMPVRLGARRSLHLSRWLHVVAVGCLAALGGAASLGPIYLTGVLGVAGLLAYEQSLVHEHDLSRLKQAFDLNGWVGFLYLVATGAAIYVG